MCFCVILSCLFSCIQTNRAQPRCRSVGTATKKYPPLDLKRIATNSFPHRHTHCVSSHTIATVTLWGMFTPTNPIYTKHTQKVCVGVEGTVFLFVIKLFHSNKNNEITKIITLFTFTSRQRKGFGSSRNAEYDGTLKHLHWLENEENFNQSRDFLFSRLSRSRGSDYESKTELGLFVLIHTQISFCSKTAKLGFVISGTQHPVSVSLQCSTNSNSLWRFESLPYNQTLTK